MLSRFCTKLAVYIGEELQQQERVAVIKYGLQIVFGALSQGMVILASLYFLGIIKIGVVIMSSFIVFRLISGGPHCTSFERCLISSLVSFIILTYLALIISGIMSLLSTVFIMTGSLIVLLIVSNKYCPGAHSARYIPQQKIRISKRIAYTFLTSIYLVGLYLCLRESYNEFAVGLLIGVAWQGFLITPQGYWCLEKFDLFLKKYSWEEVNS